MSECFACNSSSFRGIGADHVCVLQQILFFDQLDGGPGRYARHRIAANVAMFIPWKLPAISGVVTVKPTGTPLAMPFALVISPESLPTVDAEPFFPGASPSVCTSFGDEERAILLHDLETILNTPRRSDDPPTP